MKFFPVHVIFLAAATLCAQKPPDFLKYKIADSGCEAFFPLNPGEATTSWDSDSAKHFEITAGYGGSTFGIMMIDSKPGKNTIYNLSRDEYLRFQATYSSAFLERFKSRMKVTQITELVWDPLVNDQQKVLTAPVNFNIPGEKSIQARLWVKGDMRAVVYILGDKPFVSKGTVDTFLFGFRFP